ncbi:MAG: hypothetical protein ACLQM8_21860 [Limisphaerales bacterium]
MTKQTTWIIGMALAGLVALAGAGCNKKTGSAPQQQTAPTFNKVAVDLPKLRQAIATTGPKVHGIFNGLGTALRGGRYPAALTLLDRLKESPEVNDEQKKVVDQVTEQVKEAAKNQEADKPAQ